MGLINPTDMSNINFQASEKMTAPLVEIMLSQDQTIDVDATNISGSRSSKNHPIKDHMDINIACSEGNVPQPSSGEE